MNKVELRKYYLPKKFIDESTNEHVLQKVISFIEKYNHIDKIGIYVPLKGEVDILSLIVKFPHKKFFVPKIKDNVMYYTAYLPTIMLSTNKYYGIYEEEPTEDVEIFPQLVFVPALAFDIRGYRLGRGGGHYDKYFARHNIIRIGLSLSDNLMLSLPNERHDIKMNYIVTEDIILDLCH